MKNLIQNKAFVEGFILGLSISIIFNFISYLLNNICSVKTSDCGWSFGFPVNLYVEGGFLSFKEIIWVGLFTDILFAFTFSILIGSIVKAFSSSKLRNYL